MQRTQEWSMSRMFEVEQSGIELMRGRAIRDEVKEVRGGGLDHR